MFRGFRICVCAGLIAGSLLLAPSAWPQQAPAPQRRSPPPAASAQQAEPAGRRAAERDERTGLAPLPPDASAQQAEPAGRRAAERDERTGLAPLPPDRTTEHSVNVGGQTISFSATAGVIGLSNAESGAPVADVAYIAFQKDGADPSHRPVVFVFNGGPGYASGWLNLGGLGPWRLPMQGEADAPSAPPIMVDNSETWLDFADLVFIDPPGTGYSRIPGGEQARKRLWGVDGDVDALATVIRRWVEQNNRMSSPKFIAGESYGGFRAPKIARELNTNQGVGIAGLVMVSPALDLSPFDNSSILSYVGGLPSMAAVARETKHPIVRADLADVEQYAQGEFLSDLLKGPNDAAAVGRLSSKVASLTGLDPGLVRRMDGRISLNEFRRAFWRNQGKIASQYDGTVAGYDPNPFAAQSRAADQLRVGLNAPIVQAMVELYHQKLDWNVPRGRYQFFNEQAAHQWDWGRDPQAISDLREDLALDPMFRVLIVQGLTDLITPYFRTQMEVTQIPNYGPPGRLKFRVYPGGHMVYIRDEARRALHADAKAAIGGP